jgi:hypothetical protein
MRLFSAHIEEPKDMLNHKGDDLHCTGWNVVNFLSFVDGIVSSYVYSPGEVSEY